MKSTVNLETRLRVLQREVDSLRRELSNMASSNLPTQGDYERKSLEENFSRITSNAIKLLGQISIPEIFKITVEQLYSLVPDSLIGFAEFDQSHKNVIIREVKCSEQDYEKLIQVFGCNPKGYAFNFIDEIRTKLIPGGFQVIRGGFHELVFRKLSRSLCTEIEMQLEAGKIFAMPCAVENEIMGVFSIITRQHSEELINKYFMETIVNQAAMTLRRKRMEESHLESQEKFSAAFQLNPDPLVIDTTDGIILDANTSFLNLFERSRSEVIGQSAIILNMFDDQEDFKRMRRALDKVGHISNMEIKVKKKSGELRTALISSERLRSSKEGAMLTVIHDITDRKNMINALCRSEERYRQLVESANSIVMRWDVSGAILFMNNFGLRFFGYTEEEIIGDDVRILVPHQDRTGRELDGLIDGIISDPENYLQSENENIRKNGEKVWVRWANKPIRGNLGQIIEILSIGIDVTEAVRFEESLKTEHDILDAFVNNVDIGFFVMQPDGDVILHNDAGLRITEVTPGKGELNLNNYINWYILELPDGRRVDIADWPFTLALQNKFVKNFEARLVRLRSRTSRMISINSIPVYDPAGKVKLIVFTITDFTEIYERTKALEESRQRYDSLFNNATMAIQHCRIVTDENGNPVDYEMFNINNTVTKIIGITKEDVYGKRATEIFPDLDKGPFNFIEEFGKVALEGGELNTEVFFESIGKWLSIYAYCPKRGEFTAFFSDITPRKLAEIEIQKAKEKAEESDRLKSAFLANMSHEIRTPMNGILGFAELLKNPNLSGEKQQSYVEAIDMSGRRMLSIINDLIDISKIEAGQIEVKNTNTDIPKLLKDVVMFFRPEADKNKISLSLNLNNMPSSEFFIETDKTKLFQITSNLVKNALKFTKPDGFIELGCRIRELDSIFFYVKDNGIGIRQELREKIFERFRQGDTAEEHEGVGLGLAICKAYVEVLGGKIGVESEAGKGSEFYFTLPYKRNTLPLKNAPSDERINDKSLASKKILIVEDDEMSFVLLREILAERDLEIIRALNGLEAVEIIRTNNDIDLILMDVKLPVMDGIEATAAIKKINPSVPVIMQSAYAGQEEIERAFNAGSDDYMTKPINAEKFLNRISELVS